jgi:DNA-binding transcriptional LysR family regulator
MDPLAHLSWDWIKSFVAVAEQGSVAAAAAQLRSNPATISRQIAALEKHLGVSLFVRSRQGMQATLVAMQFLAPAQAMHQAMHQLSLGAAAKDQDLTGVVRISASHTLAHYVLPDLLTVFKSQYPGIVLEVLATDSISNLSAREADIAIRLVQPAQSALIAKRVAYFSIGLYASTAYVHRRGVPEPTLHNLMQHDFVDVMPQQVLREGFAQHGLSDVAQRIGCTTTDHASAWQMVRAGMGIGSTLTVVGSRDASVVRVLGKVPTGRFPVWLVVHQELRRQPRLRCVADYLTQALGSLGC